MRSRWSGIQGPQAAARQPGVAVRAIQARLTGLRAFQHLHTAALQGRRVHAQQRRGAGVGAGDHQRGLGQAVRTAQRLGAQAAAREAIHGMPMDEWKAKYQTEATPEQLARMEESLKKNADMG